MDSKTAAVAPTNATSPSSESLPRTEPGWVSLQWYADGCAEFSEPKRYSSITDFIAQRKSEAEDPDWYVRFGGQEHVEAGNVRGLKALEAFIAKKGESALPDWVSVDNEETCGYELMRLRPCNPSYSSATTTPREQKGRWLAYINDEGVRFNQTLHSLMAKTFHDLVWFVIDYCISVGYEYPFAFDLPKPIEEWRKARGEEPKCSMETLLAYAKEVGELEMRNIWNARKANEELYVHDGGETTIEFIWKECSMGRRYSTAEKKKRFEEYKKERLAKNEKIARIVEKHNAKKRAESTSTSDRAAKKARV
jgi:hypothetical protein